MMFVTHTMQLSASLVRCCSQVVRRFSTLPQPKTVIQRIGCSRTNDDFIEKYDTFMFDCDGVLWKDDHVTPLPGTADAIQKLQKLNKKILFVTNNSIVSRPSLKEKFQSHGFEASLDSIFGSGYAAALYLKHVLNITKKVYLVGGAGMKWELDQCGIESFGLGPDPDRPTASSDGLLDWKFEDDVEAVLVGFDEHFSYNKVCKAASYLLNHDCHFIVTNNVEKGINVGGPVKRRMPMTGMIASAIAETSNRQPMVVGKPFSTMFECLLKTHEDIDRERTVFIGDNLKADMAFAKEVGINSALVLTGVHMLEHVKEFPHLAPDYVIDSLADIIY